jgi:sulfonate transport system substrate-binding protein
VKALAKPAERTRDWMTRIRLTWLLLAALAVSHVLPAQAEEVVRIGWLRGTNDLTLSKARGTLDKAMAEHGARVEWDGPFPAAAPAVEALNAGSIDITLGSSTSSIASLAAKAPIVIFAYQRMGADAEALVVKDNSPIHSIADLPGHSVAVNRGGTGEYLLMRALETHGIDPATVHRVYLGPADAAPAFASGAVDAWIAWDPFLTIALDAYGARVVANGPAMGSENAIVMIASRDFTAQHRALLQVIYDTLLADNAWSVANPQAAGAIWARELKVPAAMATAFGAKDAVPTIGVGPAQTRQIESIAGWYVRSGIIPTLPDMHGSTIDLSR